MNTPRVISFNSASPISTTNPYSEINNKTRTKLSKELTSCIIIIIEKLLSPIKDSYKVKNNEFALVNVMLYKALHTVISLF